MRDVWLDRAAAVLAGGSLALFLPPEWQVWGAGLFVLLVLRLFLWQPEDFVSRLRRPEMGLLAASFLAGYLYGVVALQQLPTPAYVKDVQVSGVLQDWQKETDRAVGIFQVDSGKAAGTSQADAAQADAAQADAAQAGEAVRVDVARLRLPASDLRLLITGERYRLTVYPDKEGAYPGLWQQVRPGDHLIFRANLERPQPSGTPGGFDLRLYYAARGLSGVLTARGAPELTASGQPPLVWRIRERVRQALEPFATQDSGVLQGILFGDSSGISPGIQEIYKTTGVLHVFAASGSNVVFVLGLVWGLLFFLPKGGRIPGTALALVLYAGLCGGSPPVIRATILAEAALLGRWGRGKVPALRWLFFAAVGLLIQNPLVIRDTGFQLSLLAAWGIVVLSPRWAQAKLLSKWPETIRLATVTTLAAQAATLPILISVFHRISFVGLAANVFVLFILGGVLEIGLMGVLLSFYPPLAAPFFQAGLWLLGWANTALQELARLPWADAWVLQPGFAFWLVWYGGIGVWLFGPERVSFIVQVWRRRFYGRVQPYIHSGFRPPTSGFRISRKQLFVLALALALLVHLPQRGLEVDFLDVGQGDSILLRTPQGRAILIDAGPKTDHFDAGERIVLPYLLRNRIRELDAFFITHEHEDHIGGARAILDNIPVHWIGVPDVGKRLSKPEWTSAIPPTFWQEAGKLRTFKAGDRIDLGSGVGFEVLAPQEVLEGTHSDPNNNSLVLKLHYRGETVLFSGDMEQEEMEEIGRATIHSAETASSMGAWAADFYKVPHHGSRYSLDKPLLDELKPQAVFISVGRNTFGHPAPEVLAYWAQRHIPLYRTDEEGTIRLLLRPDGAQIRVGRKSQKLKDRN